MNDVTYSTIDMSELITGAYELGDLINQSTEVETYLYWKKRVQESDAVQRVMAKFNAAQQLFAETERFGRFHPDYNAAKDRMRAIETELSAIDEMVQFRQAEEQVDVLLYEVAKTLATAVSDTIKVPSHEGVASGCGSGGSCGCGSGGCG